MKPNKFIYIAICFLSVSCGSNEFNINHEQMLVQGKDSPIRCLEIKNVTCDSIEYYEIKSNNTHKVWIRRRTSTRISRRMPTAPGTL